MGDDWAEHAESWDSDPGPRQYANAAFASLCEILAAYERTLHGLDVVDFGCGTGLLIEHLVSDAGLIHAVDTSPAMLAAVERKASSRAWTSVVTSPSLPHAGHRVDLVVCSSVCSFLDDYPATASALISTLRPGGVLVQWDWERTTDHPDHGLSRDEVRTTLSAGGLVDVDVATAFTIEVDGTTMSPIVGHGRRPG